MRIGQVLGLRHKDILSGDNKILVRFRPDNENQARTKSLTDNVVDVSSKIITLYTDYFIHEYGEIESDYVFVNLWDGEIGAPMKYGSVITMFNRLSKKTGLKINPHIFRHTHATELLREGWDLSYVQKRLGHADIQTTANIYAHLTDEDIKKELKKFRGE
jgi:integrase